MKNGTAIIGILALFISGVFFFPAIGQAAAGGWNWQATLIAAPQAGQADQLPTALFVDDQRDRYYLADSIGNRLLSFDRKGEFLNSFDAGGELKTPYDLVRDKNGVLWVVEKGRNSLTSIDLKAQKVTPHTLTYEEREIIPDRLDYADGHFFVLDKNSGGIARLGSDLTVANMIRCPECKGGFIDFKLSPTGEILALALKDKKILRFSAQGRLVDGFHLGNKVNFPVSLAPGPAGNIFVLDRHEGSVAVYDPVGSYKYAFLSKGQSRGKLYYPIELSFDPWGNLVVVEEGNGRAEIFRR